MNAGYAAVSEKPTEDVFFVPFVLFRGQCVTSVTFYCSAGILSLQTGCEWRQARWIYRLSSCQSGFLRILNAHYHGNKGTIIPSCCRRTGCRRDYGFYDEQSIRSDSYDRIHGRNGRIPKGIV